MFLPYLLQKAGPNSDLTYFSHHSSHINVCFCLHKVWWTSPTVIVFSNTMNLWPSSAHMIATASKFTTTKPFVDSCLPCAAPKCYHIRTIAAQWILECSAVHYLFVTQCGRPILGGRGRAMSILICNHLEYTILLSRKRANKVKGRKTTLTLSPELCPVVIPYADLLPQHCSPKLGPRSFRTVPIFWLLFPNIVNSIRKFTRVSKFCNFYKTKRCKHLTKS